MIDKIKCDKKIGLDNHYYLIEVLKALEKGWLPPEKITEELYKDIQKNKESYPDYLVGYVGFQLSYGGKWFGGYRRDKVGKRDYSKEAYKNTLSQIPLVVAVAGGDYQSVDLPDGVGIIIHHAHSEFFVQLLRRLSRVAIHAEYFNVRKFFFFFDEFQKRVGVRVFTTEYCNLFHIIFLNISAAGDFVREPSR